MGRNSTILAVSTGPSIKCLKKSPNTFPARNLRPASTACTDSTPVRSAGANSLPANKLRIPLPPRPRNRGETAFLGIFFAAWAITPRFAQTRELRIRLGERHCGLVENRGRIWPAIAGRIPARLQRDCGFVEDRGRVQPNWPRWLCVVLNPGQHRAHSEAALPACAACKARSASIRPACRHSASVWSVGRNWALSGSRSTSQPSSPSPSCSFSAAPRPHP